MIFRAAEPARGVGGGIIASSARRLGAVRARRLRGAGGEVCIAYLADWPSGVYPY